MKVTFFINNVDCFDFDNREILCEKTAIIVGVIINVNNKGSEADYCTWLTVVK